MRQFLRNILRLLEPDALDFIRANPGVECSTEPPPAATEDDDDPEVRRFLVHYERFITKRYGERCEVAEPGCRTCLHWRLFDLVKISLE